ncbi:NAD-dependent epimerase/dehydratase family protein [Polynucleobacter paneuropaeus]|uniref:NAD-dependent epimerase/dehydratase family protein n=1 Tax=Polynucleobacter paneuropaeus TaxID=2527775 RepID=UPI000DBF0418|nr:NAD(P)-dependent oxidoreductase [Polynucleobacter paneuropaeus]AWW44050.1 NAD(P)-dependent oxidoreductase [Polynucleobacter paneuropaeus]
MKVILLTGATGFVGDQLLRELREGAYQIRLVLRKGSQSRIGNMKGIESVITTPDLFSESSLWWGKACEGVDTVIHSAWYAEPGKYLQSDVNLDCLIGTMNLVKGAAVAGIKKFVGLGTCLEYAMSDKPLTVDSPLEPLSPYAAAKAASFIFLSEYLRFKKIDFLWCRLFYLYGENEDARRLVPYIRHKIMSNEPVELTSGNQIRDFLDVKDAAKAIIQAMEENVFGCKNICSGVGISVRELAERIADEFGRRDLLRFGVRQENLIDPPYVVGSRGK